MFPFGKFIPIKIFHLNDINISKHDTTIKIYIDRFITTTITLQNLILLTNLTKFIIDLKAKINYERILKCID